LTSDFWHLTSKQLEPETGLYYFYARWYDPQVGRFISWDPILRQSATLSGCDIQHSFNPPFWETTQDVHPYVYAQNNPVSLIDTYGLKTEKECKECEKKCAGELAECVLEAGRAYLACVKYICVPVCLIAKGGPACAYCLIGCTGKWFYDIDRCDRKYKKCLEKECSHN
ncbi:MAG: RHS repeat-associated core domain-containing protein, partial [bacterium]|nr:RHS repeat-associated core domain-containing protein [bacterium]